MTDFPVDLALIAKLGWDSYLFAAVVILTGIGAVYGLKTRKGSGINEHPGPDSGDPVAPDRDDPSGEAGQPADATGSEKERDSTLGGRGTK